MKINVNNIPNELKEKDLWCVWKDKKIPYNPKTNQTAKTNDLSTFSDFNTAYTAYGSGKYEGLGICITQDISAIDIDHCIDEAGTLSDIAKDIIQKMNSYTEISPSGKGIRIIFSTDDFQYNKDLYYINNQKLRIEVYIAGATAKYVTITGNAIGHSPINNDSSALQEVLDLYMRRNIEVPSQTDTAAVSSSNNGDYLKIGLEKDKKLKSYWNGSRPLKSESENDMGFMAKLLYWTNGDTGLAIKAFMSSPYTAQKDEAHKKKLERKDYLPNIIKSTIPSTFAIDKHQEYQRKMEQRNSYNKQEQVNHPMQIITAQELLNKELPPVKYLIDGILPEGVSMITAAPKTGKSWLVLDMAIKIASGEPFWGKKTEPSGVLYLSLEDSWQRLQSRCKLLCNENRPDNLYFHIEVPNIENGFFDNIQAMLKEHHDIKLIIIDTFQYIRGSACNRESTYQYDSREVGLLKKFALENHISIFLVHHVRKMKDSSNPFNMISGTNGIMGAVDTAIVIDKETRKSDRATLFITGRDVSESDLLIRWNPEAFRWEYLGEASHESTEDYQYNLLLQVIHTLLETSNPWSGTATKLMEAGKQILHTAFISTPQKLGFLLKKAEDRLFSDGILCEYRSNGNSGRIYIFSKKIELSIREDLIQHPEDDEDDFSDVEF